MRLTERQVKRVLNDRSYWTAVAGKVIENQRRQAIRRGDVRPGGYIVGDSAIAEVSSLASLQQNRMSTRGEIREMAPFNRGGSDKGPTAKGAVHRHLPASLLDGDEEEISISVGAPAKTKVDRHSPDEDPDSDSQLDPDGYEERLRIEAEFLHKQGLPSGPIAAAHSLYQREYSRIVSGRAGRMSG